jgi:cobalt transporter subunit CbtA
VTFRNIIFSAVVVGIIAGSLYGIFQQTQINPIIYAAEAFEVTGSGDPVMLESHDHSGSQEHEHNHEAWAPESGFERILSTLVANILIAMAFSILLISFMSLHNLKSSKPPISWKTGAVWGIGLMLSVFAAPSLMGIHPEIPGTIAQSLEHRQIWWISSATATAAGLLMLYYGKNPVKLGGLVLIVLPQLVGAPAMEKLGFANSDPVAITELSKLSSQFVIMTSIGMLIFCVLLGALSGFASTRFVRFG